MTTKTTAPPTHAPAQTRAAPPVKLEASLDSRAHPSPLVVLIASVPATHPELARRRERWEDLSHTLTEPLRSLPAGPAAQAVQRIRALILAAERELTEANGAVEKADRAFTAAAVKGRDPAQAEAAAEAARRRVATLEARIPMLKKELIVPQREEAGEARQAEKQAKAELAAKLRAEIDQLTASFGLDKLLVEGGAFDRLAALQNALVEATH